MRFAFLRKTGASVSLLALLAACGAATGDLPYNPDGGIGGDDSGIGADVGAQDGPIGNDGAGFDAMPGMDAGGDSGHVCKAGCTSDFECMMTCPPVGGGVNCCDVGSGVCYAAASFMCPFPGMDASID